MDIVNNFLNNITNSELKYNLKYEIITKAKQIKLLENKNIPLYLTNQKGGSRNKLISIGKAEYYYNIKKLELVDKEEKLYSLEFYTLYDDIKNITIENPNMQGCGTLLYYKNINECVIQSIANYKDCIICKDDTLKWKVGDIMMQIILHNAKKLNPKVIRLSDNAKWSCNNYNFELLYLRTITHGIPFYAKYGFKAKDESIEKINKVIYKKKIMISEICFIELLEKYKFFSKEEQQIVKKELIPLYYKNMNTPVCYFMRKLLEDIKYCSILDKLYVAIYAAAGYRNYSSKEFILYNKY